MHGPRDDHTKRSKSERGRQIAYDITSMWDLKIQYDTNELIYKTETDSGKEKRLAVAKGCGVGVG